jgi:hypothetical protein
MFHDTLDTENLEARIAHAEAKRLKTRFFHAWIVRNYRPLSACSTSEKERYALMFGHKTLGDMQDMMNLASQLDEFLNNSCNVFKM